MVGEVWLRQVKQRRCRCEVLCLAQCEVKCSAPIVPKAHFTHEVRFTCKAYFTFRGSGTLRSKKPTFVRQTNVGFFVAEGEGFEPPQTESESGVLPLHKPSKLYARLDTCIIIYRSGEKSRTIFQFPRKYFSRKRQHYASGFSSQGKGFPFRTCRRK